MAPPGCLNFALEKGPALSSLRRPPAAPLVRVSSASPSSSAGPTPTSLSARIPIPSPVSISPCAGAPPAPSLLAGSPARRERKVNGQPNHKDKLP